MGLEYVRHALLNQHGLNKETVVPVIHDAVNRFARDHGMAPISGDRWRMALRVVRTGEGTVLSQEEGALSPRVQYYQDQIVALGNNETDLQSYLSHLSALESAAYAELSGPDSLAVWTTADLARNSAGYWNANYASWAQICTDNPDLCEDWDGSAFPPVGQVQPMGINWRGWKVLVSDLSAGVVAGLLSGCNPFAVAIAAFAASALAFVLTA